MPELTFNLNFILIIKSAIAFFETGLICVAITNRDAMRKFIVGLMLLAALATGAHAAADIPATRAGTALSLMLTAFNSQRPGEIAAFKREYGVEGISAEEMTGLSGATGGFHFIRAARSTPTEVQALVQENRSEQYAMITLAVTPSGRLTIEKGAMRPVETPADLAPQRMSMNAALGDLRSHADAMAAQDRFSGVVLVAKGDAVLLQHAWGEKNRELHERVRIDTRFRIGSINKALTAVAILQLVEQGRVALGDPIGAYLPDYPNRALAEQVTIGQLLTHTGATGDIFGPQFDQKRAELKSHADYIALYGQRPLDRVPGQQFAYSNYGYVLLGAIIEKVSGMPYDAYMQQHVYAVAGMTDTGTRPEEQIAPAPAIGYMRVGGAWMSAASTLPYSGTAAGGGYSTATDLLRFATALQSGKLLSSRMLALATSKQVANYGYGWQLDTIGGAAVYGHSGGAPGISAGLTVIPSTGVVMVVLSNQDGRPASILSERFKARMPLK